MHHLKRLVRGKKQLQGPNFFKKFNWATTPQYFVKNNYNQRVAFYSQDSSHHGGRKNKAHVFFLSKNLFFNYILTQNT